MADAEEQRAVSDSTPRKAPALRVAEHNLAETSQFSVPHSLQDKVSVAEFWDLYKLKKCRALSGTNLPVFNPQDPCAAFNQICSLLPCPEEHRIRLYESGSIEPLKHPAHVHCRPDYLAVRNDNTHANNEKLTFVDWSMVELVVGKIPPSEKNFKEWLTYTGAYYLHDLVLARPDLTTCQALLIDKDRLVFLFGKGSRGITYTSVPFSDTKDLSALLYAFLRRLVQPSGHMVDSTVKRVYDKPSQICTWTIALTVDGQPLLCRGFELRVAHLPFDRRTHVFVNNSPTAPSVNGMKVRVIKDQYCRPGSRFSEDEIFEAIQREGKVPGVVYAVHCEVWEVPGENRRNRMRIAMDQVGEPFTDVSTIRQGLYLFYDLLELMRFLFTKRSVLHRDISDGNVLFDSGECFIPQSEQEKAEFSSLHYISGMLDQRQVVLLFYYALRRPFNSSSSTSQWKTTICLTDFDRGSKESDKAVDFHYSATGTPMFMARAVESGQLPFDTVMLFPPMPATHPVYAGIHQERCARYPTGENRLIVEHDGETVALRKHLLRHDAESAFWLFIYWILLSQPVDSLSPEPVPAQMWGLLHGDWVGRDILIRYFARAQFIDLYSRFQPLGQLIRDLAGQLVNDHSWLPAANASMNDNEFVLEALQRVIFTFVQRYNDDGIMDIQLSRSRRKPQEITKGPSIPSKRSRPTLTTQQHEGEPGEDVQNDHNEHGPSTPKRSRMMELDHTIAGTS